MTRITIIIIVSIRGMDVTFHLRTYLSYTEELLSPRHCRHTTFFHASAPRQLLFLPVSPGPAP